MRNNNLNYKRKSGFTLIEVIIVLALIAILSSLIAVYTVSSSKLSTNIKKEYDEVSEARIAMSYIVNILQQNDISNAISVDKTDASNPILYVKRNGDERDKVKIFYDSSQGMLKEATDTYDSNIAKISGFSVEYKNAEKAEDMNYVQIKIQYKNISDGSIKEINQKVTLRSVNYKMGGTI
ncbi:prepilin-type N-terminal cleavage/methylation domain-containing protein [Hathewaya proteolytica DSM 3090]|uniref:Prepilin-type N-terminal cleavage/methylation domain-containing protein n=1 Tax=Hathewaya proteolytica DSM 3090 TaxID=1121331 RepID=A0A1M6LHQ9_9CLOT|nr:type II secretion system protein [Hathewaya proteolytica]SHJ70655.1 prepilin-type N-terminal cleavage/methylation domain-containing protein [Hathewaya proteolytica DSM 3090]